MQTAIFVAKGSPQPPCAILLLSELHLHVLEPLLVLLALLLGVLKHMLGHFLFLTSKVFLLKQTHFKFCDSTL
jgi:hypothetical protein